MEIQIILPGIMPLVKLLMVILGLMLVLRSGVFVVRLVQEMGQEEQGWRPANQNEQMILENYVLVGK